MRIITISREFGSGGRELGKRLAEALEIPYYDKEILYAIAKEGNFNEDYVEEVLQRGLTPNFMPTFGHTFSLGPNPVMENELEIMSLQQKIIENIAQKGDCVIVGRTSGIILEKFRPMKIFVYADMGARLARCRLRGDDVKALSDKELQKKIQKIDEGRARHQRLFSDKKWGQKENYHLCVNTTGVEIAALVPAVKAYATAWFEQQEAD